MAQTLTESFRTVHEEGEVPPEEPGFLSVILGFGRLLKERLARLVAADEDHYAEKAVYTALLERRDSLSRKLTGMLVALRRTVLGHHEEPDMGRLGLEGESAREPVPALRQADRIIKVFAQGEIEALAGPTIFDGVPFETKGRERQLKTVADELREVLDEIGDAKRRTEDAYLKKIEATEGYDRLFTRAARTFEDWCRLIGRNDLADRIRPSERRPGRTVQEPPEPSEESTDPASGEASPEEAPAQVSSEESTNCTATSMES